MHLILKLFEFQCLLMLIVTTYGRAATVYLSGPKFAYILPVDEWSNSSVEASMKLDSTSHQRDIRFGFDQVEAEADFNIPKYLKKQVRVVDAKGQPVRDTQVRLCPNTTVLPRATTVTTSVDGLAEFVLDRPIIKSTAWVANADGFGMVLVEGMSDEITALALEPAIAIPGLLTAKATDGKLRAANGIQIFLKHENHNEFAQMDLAVSDKNGRFTVYLSGEHELKAKLFVMQVHNSSDYEWEVELNENARADFVMDDDRLP